MPRPPRGSEGAIQHVAVIDGRMVDASLLTMGFMETTLDSSTLARKRSEINTFLSYLEKGIFDFSDCKVSCRAVLDWMVTHLDENPLCKGAAVNKLTSVIQALTIANLIEPDPVFLHTYGVMKKLALSAAKNVKMSKAKVICLEDPLKLLPFHCRRLAALWLMTGVRAISLEEINRTYEPQLDLPIEAAQINITQKTITASKPFVICVCDLPSCGNACPLHCPEIPCSSRTTDQVNTILTRLQITRHSFRRTLAVAFRLHSKHRCNPAIAEAFGKFIDTVFGWKPPARKTDKSMFYYYSSDYETYSDKALPTIVMRTIQFYDEAVPLITANPLNATQFAFYRSWQARLNTLKQTHTASSTQKTTQTRKLDAKARLQRGY